MLIDLCRLDAQIGRIEASWKLLLNGLWWSGLRLDEAMQLTWDEFDKPSLDFTGRLPMLRMPAESEKGHKDRLMPIAPEFAEFLQSIPDEDRDVHVFNPLPRRVKGPRLTSHSVGTIISKIGVKAAVKVSTDPKSGKVKHASAHDLRRSFGERWSQRLMPAQLQQLMRHESIDTTMRFYVGRNAETTAAALWEAVGNTQGNRAAESSSANEECLPQPQAATGISK